MKSLFPNFKDRICNLIRDFQAKLFELAEEFHTVSKQKNFHLYARRVYCLDPINYDIIKQGLLSILDMSVHELNVRMLNNSLLHLEAFYLYIEDAVLNVTKEFMHDLFKKYPVKVFTAVSIHYCEVIGEAGIKRTQRRLTSFVYACIRNTIANKIFRSFLKFIITTQSNAIEEVKEEEDDSSDSVSPDIKEVRFKNQKLKIKPSHTKGDEDFDSKATQNERDIARRVEEIINSTPCFQKLSNSELSPVKSPLDSNREEV